MKIKIDGPQLILAVVQYVIATIAFTCGCGYEIGPNKVPSTLFVILGTFFGIIAFNLLLLVGGFYGDDN